jgi:heptosyltransferase-1
MRILILKLASMGDLIHLLPALTDAKQAHPNIVFDWVIDTHFSEIATWHKAIDQPILTDHRTWRSHLTKKSTYHAINNMLRIVRNTKYDLVIDAQGNLKTAFLSLFTKGKTAGWDGASIPEWGAHFCYSIKAFCSKKNHAITKMRSLLADTIGYSLPTSTPDYQIEINKLKAPSFPLPLNFFVFVPNASHPSKLWPTSYWKTLIKQSESLGYSILLPWGSLKEKKQAEELAACSSNAIALPKMSLSEIGFILSQAKKVVSMDTGLSHIAAALDIPTITLYGPTDPTLTGTVGKNQIHLCSSTTCLSSLGVGVVFDALCNDLSFVG